MSYYQKYLKYKAKYVFTQTGGGFTDAKGEVIAHELQKLDDAFLPDFNVDAKYVEPLLAVATSSKNSLGVILFLQALNNLSENGLNHMKDRLSPTQKQQTKDVIRKKLEEMLSAPESGGRKEALDLYKQVSVNYNLATTDPAFQALDDAFLPGFNVDKAYVGHLYVLCRDSKTTTDVINGLIKLNNASNGGLNAKGDRLSLGQTKKPQNEIEKALKALKPDEGGRQKALKDFKAILDIKAKPVPETPKEFQALDDAFLPGFNVDKAYVGHLYMLCKTKESTSTTEVIQALSTTEVIQALIELNNASVGGLNYIGDRLTASQKQQSKEAIKTALIAMKSSPDGQNILNALTAFNKQPGVNKK